MSYQPKHWDNHQHEHQFKVEESTEIFTCGGCKSIGHGPRRYNCTVEECDFILHIPCGEPKEHFSHSFYKNCIFEFLTEAPPEAAFCAACGENISGYNYYCSNKEQIYLHPLCAELPHHYDAPGKNTTFTLHHNVGMMHKCYRCGKHKLDNVIEGWSYVSDGHLHQKVHYHIVCFHDIISDIVMANPSLGPSRKEASPEVLKAAESSVKIISDIFTPES